MFSLPGGYQPPDSDGPIRSVTPRPLDGNIELALAEASEKSSRTEVVTSVLTHLIEKIGDLETTPEIISNLSVADRTFALIQFSLDQGRDRLWRSLVCGGCGERFDVSIDLAGVAAGKAPETFPEIAIETSLGPLVVRAPTGADQTAVSQTEDIETGCKALLDRCLRTATGKKIDLAALKKKDAEVIGEAFDKLALNIPLSSKARCPHCDTTEIVPLEIFSWISFLSGEVLDQVHEIASAYHWPERDILNLPRPRRLKYLQRINPFEGENFA